tara:strand:+ start:183 stop:455 length:273 start_codon:yes stop_codon:yes gene_type:complete
MENLKTYEAPVKHIKNAEIRWYMNVWENTVMDSAKLKLEFGYSDEDIKALIPDGHKPRRLVETRIYKSEKMARRWFKRCKAEQILIHFID